MNLFEERREFTMMARYAERCYWFTASELMMALYVVRDASASAMMSYASEREMFDAIREMSDDEEGEWRD